MGFTLALTTLSEKRLLRAETEKRQGRLRVPVKAAARAIEASTTGAVLLLLAQPEALRDARLIKPLRDTVLDSLTIEPTPGTDPEAITSARSAALLAVLSPRPGRRRPADARPVQSG